MTGAYHVMSFLLIDESMMSLWILYNIIKILYYVIFMRWHAMPGILGQDSNCESSTRLTLLTVHVCISAVPLGLSSFSAVHSHIVPWTQWSW